MLELLYQARTETRSSWRFGEGPTWLRSHYE